MSKGAKSRHLQARVTFLDRAAKLLAAQQFTIPTNVARTTPLPDTPSTTAQDDSTTTIPQTAVTNTTTNDTPQIPNTGLPLLLSSHMRTVAKRGQVRIAQDVKRSICKICSTPLIEDKTSSTRIENASTGGRKAHADVKVVECLNCGGLKRFPIGARRQAKRSQRTGRKVRTEGQAKDAKGGKGKGIGKG
ncbi:hypothetical protein BDZ85DRAFT_467 [Elsinoe ampelina]|uniref:RNAse P Rpr2/Rpp21/SNM1 subunit domain-containing protein n=1 Tax=Elsinoe ampelina TaxID=302913 RepID=A0A6A6GN98_9PEZI|nr:hypothetical protein BDZ85DRAFT_467 [Elsinoe ampelina]